MKPEIIKINKKELENIKTLMLSTDKELGLLGYKMLINSDFIKTCKPKTLINYNHSFYSDILSLKSNILNYTTHTTIKIFFDCLLKNNYTTFSRAIPIKIDTTDEQLAFKYLGQLSYCHFYDISSDCIRKLFTKSKIFQDNINNLFLYKSKYYRLSDFNQALTEFNVFYNVCYHSAMIGLIRKLSDGKITFYKDVPVKIISE